MCPTNIDKLWREIINIYKIEIVRKQNEVYSYFVMINGWLEKRQEPFKAPAVDVSAIPTYNWGVMTGYVFWRLY